MNIQRWWASTLFFLDLFSFLSKATRFLRLYFLENKVLGEGESEHSVERRSSAIVHTVVDRGNYTERD